MVSIPSRTQRVGIKSTPVVMESNAVGEAVERGAQQMASAINGLGNRLDAQRKKDDAAEANRLYADYLVKQDQIKQDIKLNGRGDFETHEAAAYAQDEALRQSLMAGASTGAAKMFDDMAVNASAKFQIDARHLGRAIRAGEETAVALNVVNSMHSRVVVNPDFSASAKEAGVTVIESMANVDEQTKQKLITDHYQRVSFARLDGLLNLGADGATVVLDEIEGGKHSEIGSSVDTYIDRANNLIRSDADRRVNALRADMGAAKALVASGEVMKFLPFSSGDIDRLSVTDDKKAQLRREMSDIYKMNDMMGALGDMTLQQAMQQSESFAKPAAIAETDPQYAVETKNNIAIFGRAVEADLKAFVTDQAGYVASRSDAVKNATAALAVAMESGDLSLITEANAELMDASRIAQARKAGAMNEEGEVDGDFVFMPVSKAHAESDANALMDQAASEEDVMQMIASKQQLYGDDYAAYASQLMANKNMPASSRWLLGMGASVESRLTRRAIAGREENEKRAIASGTSKSDIETQLQRKLGDFNEAMHDTEVFNAAYEASYSVALQNIINGQSVSNAAAAAVEQVVNSQGTAVNGLFVPKEYTNPTVVANRADAIIRSIPEMTDSLAPVLGMSQVEWKDLLSTTSNIRAVPSQNGNGVIYVIDDPRGPGALLKRDGSPLFTSWQYLSEGPNIDLSGAAYNAPTKPVNAMKRGMSGL